MKNSSLLIDGKVYSKEASRVEEIYSELLSEKWKEKVMWESIRDGELTAVPCLVGKRFHSESVKVMVVGRAVNGWEVEFEDCSSLDATVNSVLTQKNCMDDFATDWVLDENGKKYYYAKSPFLRMMRQLVGAFAGTEEDWQQRLAWSNLFKIAPRHGKNPSWLMIRKNISLYCEIIKEEINQNAPDIVVFVTDMNYFDPYPNHNTFSSFLSLMDMTNLCNIRSEYVCIAGDFIDNRNTKLVACKRPEGRPIDKMIKDIVNAYNELKI